jgi:hypothetical protein
MSIWPRTEVPTPTAALAGTRPGDSVSGRRRRRLAAIYLGGTLLAVAVITAGAIAGYWFAPFIIGLTFGLTARYRLRFVLLVTVAVAMAGWAIPLAWQAWHGVPIVATAWAVAGFAGLPASAALILGGTLLTAALQAFTGLWLGRTSRRWAREYRCWAANPGRTRRSRSSL